MPGENDSATPTRTSIPLRNLTSAVISGTDAPTLETAMNAFLEAAGDDQMLVSMMRVADYKVLVIYAA